MTKIFLSLLAISAVPAFAEPPLQVTSIVETADLDLASAYGQRQLDRRLSVAAAEVCGTASNADLAGKNEVRECRKTTLSAAKARRDQVLASKSGDRSISIAAR